MRADLETYHWDSCLFYEILKGEPRPINERVAIQELLHDNKKQHNRICTSVITHAEVIPKKLDGAPDERYWTLFSTPYFFDIEVDRNILMRARELRDYYFREGDGEGEGGSKAKVLSTGDALQLATALIHEVTEFHTRDGKRKGGKVPLLGLPESSANGKLCGKYPLKISSPTTIQGNLDVQR